MTRTPTEWAYAAAIIDGEGSCSLTRSTLRLKDGTPYRTYDCKIMVGNTSVALIAWLEEKFGGKSYISVKKIGKSAAANGQKTLKPCIRWYVAGYDKTEEFLVGIMPYLVIKRTQAENCLEFVRMNRKKNPARRAELYRRNIALNKGQSVETNTPCFPESAPGTKIESELTGDSESAPTVM